MQPAAPAHHPLLQRTEDVIPVSRGTPRPSNGEAGWGHMLGRGVWRPGARPCSARAEAAHRVAQLQGWAAVTPPPPAAVAHVSEAEQEVPVPPRGAARPAHRLCKHGEPPAPALPPLHPCPQGHRSACPGAGA